MFVRRIKSRNSICFQIGKKLSGKFVLVKHVGCASTPERIEALRIKAEEKLRELVFKDQLSLFPDNTYFSKAKLLSWSITGYHQVFGHVYDLIGFPNNLLRDLTIARIVYPKSKIATLRYLNQNFGISIAKDRVYRFLDTLDKDSLTKVAFNFVSKKNHGISLLFYDVTTLYFEIENDDDFRQKGYSKDHRADVPQILIGLFVDKAGYPFDFDFFAGSVFEGHTFQTAIEKIIQKYAFAELTVVADAAMLSEANFSYLDSRGINYVVGARLKNLPKEIITPVFKHDFLDRPVWETILRRQRLIIDYSKERAKQDAKTRDKLIRKLEEKLNRGESLIHKSKYLLWEKQGRVLGIDKKQIKEDEKYDGLKGYLTNPTNYFKAEDVIKQYHNLWRVERAFRMSKSDLRERPVYHRKLIRIKSHLIICFVSLLVMKETETKLRTIHYSLEQAIEILGKVARGKIRLGKILLEVDSEPRKEAQEILNLFNKGH